MIENLMTAASGLCLVLGSFVLFSGGVGVLRFPDFYTRMHAAGVTDTLAAGLILTGLMLLVDSWLVLAKLVMILLFLLLTSPTASHTLAQAARHGKLAPKLKDSDNE